GSPPDCSSIQAHLLQPSMRLSSDRWAFPSKQRESLRILPVARHEKLVQNKSTTLGLATSKRRERNLVLPHCLISRCSKAVQESAVSWESIRCTTIMPLSILTA